MGGTSGVTFLSMLERYHGTSLVFSVGLGPVWVRSLSLFWLGRSSSVGSIG